VSYYIYLFDIYNLFELEYKLMSMTDIPNMTNMTSIVNTANITDIADMVNKETIRIFPRIAGRSYIIYGQTSGIICKRMEKSDNEFVIYNYISEHYDKFLKKYVPKLYGKNNDMLLLEDLTYNYNNPNVMDVKIGARKRKSHTSGFFSIRGYTNSHDYKFDPDEYLTSESTINHIKNFMEAGGENRDKIKQVLLKWIIKLSELANDLFEINLKFDGVSLIFIYDDDCSKCDVNVVDFSRVKLIDTNDQMTISAVTNLIKILSELTDNSLN